MQLTLLKQKEIFPRCCSETVFIPASHEIVGDLKKMTAMGIIGTPAVAVDGKVVLAGSVPSAAACAALLGKYR